VTALLSVETLQAPSTSSGAASNIRIIFLLFE
jgi:hypothetical protein